MYHATHFWLLLDVYLLINKILFLFFIFTFSKKKKKKKELSEIEHGSWDLTCV